MAQPKPPPMTHARRAPSSSVGLPSGPTKSRAGPRPPSCARKAHGGGPDRLEHDGDGARLRVRLVHGERDALARLVDAQHDELPGRYLARDLRARTTMRVTSAFSASTASIGYIVLDPYRLQNGTRDADAPRTSRARVRGSLLARVFRIARAAQRKMKRTV